MYCQIASDKVIKQVVTRNYSIASVNVKERETILHNELDCVYVLNVLGRHLNGMTEDGVC